MIYGVTWEGLFELVCKDADGNVLWRENLHNDASMVNGGHYEMMDTYFRAGAAPGSFYLRLYANSLAGGPTNPAKTHTLANLTGEISGFGYAPAALARNTTDWPTLSLDLGDYRIRSKQVVVGPTGGNWGTFNYVVCATTTGSAGPIISWAKTTQPRQLNDGETLPIHYNVKLAPKA